MKHYSIEFFNKKGYVFKRNSLYAAYMASTYDNETKVAIIYGSVIPIILIKRGVYGNKPR